MATVRRITAMKALWNALRGARRRGAPGVSALLAAVPRMVVLGLTGRYPHLAKGRLALGVLGLAYVLSPLNLVPELLLPILGLGDDMLVVAWLAGTVLAEAEAFLAWEREQEPSRSRSRSRVIVGEVVS
jgi:uncharacterized membrane protein YkvA (DUF1232 family)